MAHRTQDTYLLTNFREKTGEHLARLAEGRIETITQNGEAAMVVMSPGRYDFLVHAAERGHVWKAAIDRLDAREIVREIADGLRRDAAKRYRVRYPTEATEALCSASALPLSKPSSLLCGGQGFRRE